MPNGEQLLEQGQEGEDSAEESGDWESPDDGDEEESDESDDEEAVDSLPRCLAQNIDPSNTMIPRAGAVRLWPRAFHLKSTLDLRLQSWLRKSPSSPRSIPRRPGRPCLRSRWMFLLLLGKCSSRVFLYRLILLS